MRILQISNKAPYPPNDGSSIAIYNMAKGFLENDVELHFLCINTKKHFKEDKNIPPDFLRQSNYTSVYKNTDVTFLGAVSNLFSSQSYFVSRFYFETFSREIIKKLRENRFDIIQLEGIFLGNYIPLIRTYSNAKIVIRAHNVEHLIWERMLENEKNILKKKYIEIQNKRLKKFELNTFSNADLIVPITSEDEICIKNLKIHTPTFVSPTGIDLNRYIIQSEKVQSGTVFHFGSMDWMPNIEAVEWLLKEIWTTHFSNNTGISLTLAGRFMPEHLQKIQGRNIKIVSEVENNIDFYNSHEIMLVPLLSGSGMRIKIVEGMAMGKCILTTSVGAEGIPITNGENILIADNATDMIKLLSKVLEEKEFREKIGTNARKFIEEKFDNKKILADLKNFFESQI